MTVGFYSPLPPAPTGVADYAATLLAGLRQFGDVAIAPSRCDVALYHLGNNSLHAAIYRRAIAHPGIVVLHDAVLHHFLLGHLDERNYIEEFVYNYGEWHRGLARDLWRWRGGSGSDSRYFEWPMLRRAAESARAIVVHNPAAAAAVLAHAPTARVTEIPHLFAMPDLPGGGAVLRYREAIGIEPGDFVFGIFGYLRESKRLITVLETFAAVRREIPNARLLVAGSFASSDLERAATPLLSCPGVVRLPFLTEREFWLAASASDACINLRYPSTGETSGISIRLMGIGKPVLMTDALECSRFPEGAFLRIEGGMAERESLHHHMILAASMPELAREVGGRAERHIQQSHTVEEVARQFWEALRAN
ncbi:MAG TPA: glycosyltransferase [Bryobacteraceae bacterium]|nr:glycosyltransferase [Bryobacteraceae bacterium]